MPPAAAAGQAQRLFFFWYPCVTCGPPCRRTLEYLQDYIPDCTWRSPPEHPSNATFLLANTRVSILANNGPPATGQGAPQTQPPKRPREEEQRDGAG